MLPTLFLALQALFTGSVTTEGGREFVDAATRGDRMLVLSETGARCEGFVRHTGDIRRVELSCSDGRRGFVTFLSPESAGYGRLAGEPLVLAPN